MKFKKISFLFFLTFVSLEAKVLEAVARHGTPKHEGSFKNLDDVNAQAPKGGKLRLGTVGTFDTVNKDIVKGIVAQGILLCYDALMFRNPDEPFSLYPLLAEKVDLEEDASKITFFLNPKATFSDGTPVTAEDVKFTINLLMNDGLPRYKHYYSLIQEMKVEGNHKITFIFKKKEGKYDPELPLIIASVRVLSKKQIEKIDFKNSGLTPIIGSGPYKVKKVDMGRSIVLERRTDYWGKDLPVNAGRYNFDEVRVDYYKNAAAQFQSFLAGEFDIYYDADPSHWHSAYKVPAVESGKIKRVSIHHKRPVTTRMMIFNMRRPLFQDIRVRKALSMAFDFDSINKVAFQNSLVRMRSLFANTFLEHPKTKPEGDELKLLEPFKDQLPKEIFETGYQPFTTKGDGNQRENLEKAQALLKESGWILKAGKLLDKQGNPFKLTFMINEPRLEKVALSYKRSLARLGIEMTVKLVDRTEYEMKVNESDFDMIMHAWSNGLSPGIEQTYYFSAENATRKGSSNYIGITSPAIEALSKKVPDARDTATLATAVHALDRAVMGSHYFVPFGYNAELDFAFWPNRICLPTYNENKLPNVLDCGWASPEQLKKKDDIKS